ncbi:MAG: hypothetical protein SGJ04_07640 [Bacteroidota bacterium]|nr:hypothetical protein [Bacteroidota bacterium]
MTTDSNYQQDEIQEENKNRRNNVLLISIALLLLGSIAFNIFQYYDKDKKVDQLNQNILNSDALKEDLRVQLDSIRSELGSYKGRNSQLDSLVASKEAELIEQASKIEGLLKDNKISYNKYLSVKSDLEKFKFYSDKYLEDVKRLDGENKKLVKENSGLKEEVKGKEKEIDKLTDEVVLKGNKLELASRLVIDPKDINAQGVKFRKGGSKESETDRAKYIEKVKVCFVIPKNLAASNGKKKVYIQIVDPRGQSVTMNQLGSGIINIDGEDAKYSTSTEIDYDNEAAANQCIYWGGPDIKYEPGRYNVVLFTDGYKMGEKSFIIK